MHVFFIISLFLFFFLAMISELKCSESSSQGLLLTFECDALCSIRINATAKSFNNRYNMSSTRVSFRVRVR